MTLLRSFSYIYHHYGEEDLKVEDALEIGREHTFEYNLYPHQGDWRKAKSYRVALQFNNPLKMIKLPEQVSQGSLPEKWNFLDVEPKNLIVSACKKRKDGQVVLMDRFLTLN